MDLPDQRHRRSVRLKDYDYSQAGAYFITVCAHDRECLFGEIVDGGMRLNDWGRVVQEEWLDTAAHHQGVELDASVVMPNHFHGILVIHEGIARYAPTSGQFGKMTPGSLPAIIRSFKSATTKAISELRGTLAAPVWQRSFYEHVIRNETELNKAREYITNNPLKWDLDSENPVKTTPPRTDSLSGPK